MLVDKIMKLYRSKQDKNLYEVKKKSNVTGGSFDKKKQKQN